MSNEILELRGSFDHSAAKNPGPPSLPKGGVVTTDHLASLRHQLENVSTSLQGMTEIGIPIIVSVRYIRVIAKSNRAKRLLSKGAEDASGYIVGSKLDSSSNPNAPKHVITYCIPTENIESTVHCLAACEDYIHGHYGPSIGHDEFKQMRNSKFDRKVYGLSKTALMQAIRDSYYIESFFVDEHVPDISEESFTTLYDTNIDTKQLLNKLGLDIEPSRIIGRDVRLYGDEYRTLREKAPSLVSMSLFDIADMGNNKGDQGARTAPAFRMEPVIDAPDGEPFIGVIDVVFSRGAYFDKWVIDEDYTDPSIPAGNDTEHGTKVCSIIIDGPSLNPELEDGCGRFQVRHFGVTKDGTASVFGLLREIRDIVESNSTIKVWNLSLGDPSECPENFISPVAALLDELQAKCDVIFIVAGTNTESYNPSKRIGSPADSINSIVVNSVDDSNNPARYSRTGPVLSFYSKPDIAYYGGTQEKPLKVATSAGISEDYGTSYSAPWITRKVAFLIYKANRTKEEAKALIIDSSYRWSSEPPSNLTGFGVPPIHISEILSTPNDEIRFMVSTIVDSYETHSHRFPVPLDRNGRYPFMARATLCYFPHCSRSQGVDYADTEIDLHFGRIKKKEVTKRDTEGHQYKDYTYNIASLDGNTQGDEGCLNYEGAARLLFRKWDNVKHICDKPKSRFAPRKTYDEPNWGMLLRRKSRTNASAAAPLRVCVVVTLKEMQGRNRFDEFARDCSFGAGWVVNRLSLDVINEIHEIANEEIEFE